MFKYNFHLLGSDGVSMVTAYHQSADNYEHAIRLASEWWMDQHALNSNYKSLRVEQSSDHEEIFFGTMLPHNITTERPSILALCEANSVVLRADRLYKFTVVPGCEKCEAIRDSYAVKGTEK